MRAASHATQNSADYRDSAVMTFDVKQDKVTGVKIKISPFSAEA